MAESVNDTETGQQSATDSSFKPSTEQQQAAELLDLSASQMSDGADQSELIQSVRLEANEYSDLANLQPEVGVVEVSKDVHASEAVLYAAVELVIDKQGSLDQVAPVTNPDGREQIPVPIPPTEEPVFEPIEFGHDTSPIGYQDSYTTKTEDPEYPASREESNSNRQPVAPQSTTKTPSNQKPPSGTTAPETTEPATTEPATTEPATTEPATTEPATTEPATTEPATTEPATTEPA
ncbi:MAG: hypothetical protein HQM06_08090, partial [Magnetococcales bacterium]|nr:hypothetical protein [Magnetococcales bacterium]